MKIEILNKDYNLPLIDRLLKIRSIENKEVFLNPTWQNSWHNPFKLEDIDKAINRIIEAIKNNERIIVFWDYDVDWVTSTYALFYFIYKFLNYKNISIRLPSRQDGYWIKNFHMDELKEKNVSLIITVDNWITALEEVEYAKKLWIDVIITDHHTPLENVPDAFAVINPKVSPNYPFKELSWVWVSFKLITWLANKLNLSAKTKEQIINYFLPIVAIWTVADCVPLVDENRFLVKKWLEIINNKNKRPPNIDNMINFLNLKNVDSYHIWFVIWPRLNASWRIHTPHNSFQALFQHNKNIQAKYLEKLEEMNKQRQSTQLDILSEIEKSINLDDNILLAIGDFHEWIIWIVAWRLTEKYNKPAIVMSINKEKNEAVGSCRSPAYFSIIEMLEDIWKKWIFKRYGWHKQAGWLTIDLKYLDDFRKELKNYESNILKEDLEKIVFIDTEILKKDLLSDDMNQIPLLAPFWVQNHSPSFLINSVKIKKIDLVGKEKNHIKIYWEKEWVDLTLLKWSWIKFLEKIKDKETINVIAEYSKDDFNGWFYFKIIDLV